MVSENDTVVRLPLLGDLTYREAHALEDGFYVGYRDINVDNEVDEEEYDVDKHYWRMAWLLGHWTRKYVDRNTD